ncbi:MAG TPA: CHRD domain-containing protein [Gemmatimonadaceae bacterium]|nr:CHRD domain-containing protein [Gemmatimonadaceae bacterium]
MHKYMILIAALITVAACNMAPVTVPQSPTYMSIMAGADEVPTGVLTPGSGTVEFYIKGQMLTYTVAVSQLSSNATAASLSVGGAQVNGGVLFPFLPLTQARDGQIASGSIDLSQPVHVMNGQTINGDSLLALFANGNAYANVQTAQHPAGEIRGQVMKVQ